METLNTNTEPQYLFLVKKDDEDRVVLVVDKDHFEMMDYADSYTRYGQQIGRDDAGDYYEGGPYCDFQEGDEEVATQVKGYTYWDGSNFQTAIIEHEHGVDDALTHEVLEDTEAYEKALAEMQHAGEGFGRTYYEAGDYIVVRSFWQGAWFKYEILHKVDHAHLLEAIHINS